jgi:uncharacterized protein (TIGR02145 family)
VYGGLYQWDEMMQYSTAPGVQGICQTGWHVPTDSEVTTLTNFLGGLDVAGGKMKEAGTVHWAPPNTGATNSSGFTGLPGGCRLINGNLNNLTYFAYFWSSSEYSTANSWFRYLGFTVENVFRGNDSKLKGFSIRCIKN